MTSLQAVRRILSLRQLRGSPFFQQPAKALSCSPQRSEADKSKSWVSYLSFGQPVLYNISKLRCKYSHGNLYLTGLNTSYTFDEVLCDVVLCLTISYQFLSRLNKGSHNGSQQALVNPEKLFASLLDTNNQTRILCKSWCNG